MNPDLWQFIQEHLTNNERVILMVVIDVKGSSPGRPGFKMAVAGNGEISGSIGGGVMEYNMVEDSRKLLKEKKTETLIKRQVHIPDAEDKSGLICAGEQTQAFIPLSSSDLMMTSQIIECIERGEKGVLKISPNEFRFAGSESLPDHVSAFYGDSYNWEYYEEIGLADTVYIFGAGHISLPLSQILRMLDFRVIVFDDRKELTTFNANSFAHQKKVIDYGKIGELVPGGKNSYAAIMSFGHKSDKIILSQLLRRQLKYLGMIGSKSKVKSIYDSLREEGFSSEDFSGVDSPMGVSINSQTPAEIAVSIAARIIQVRNSK